MYIVQYTVYCMYSILQLPGDFLFSLKRDLYIKLDQKLAEKRSKTNLNESDYSGGGFNLTTSKYGAKPLNRSHRRSR